jgi:hypothetical protein
MIASTLSKRGFAWPRFAKVTMKRSLRKKRNEAKSPSLGMLQAWEQALTHQANLMVGKYEEYDWR